MQQFRVSIIPILGLKPYIGQAVNPVGVPFTVSLYSVGKNA